MKRRGLRIAKIFVDLMMYVLFCLLMEQHLLSGIAHEWIGLSLFLLFMLHTAFNFRWYLALFKGRYTAFRIVQTALDLLLFVFVIGCILSSFILSQNVFSWMHIPSSQFGRGLHLLSTSWAFVFVSMHLGWHFRFLPKKYCSKAKRSALVVLEILLLAVSVYGLVVFIQRSFYEEMFLLTLFKQYEYDVSPVLYLGKTMAMSLSFALIGYGIRRLVLFAQRRVQMKKRGETK